MYDVGDLKDYLNEILQTDCESLQKLAQAYFEEVPEDSMGAEYLLSISADEDDISDDTLEVIMLHLQSMHG